MSYFLFAIILVLTYIRPIELFFPELEALRPVFIVAIFAAFAALLRVSQQKREVFSTKHLVLFLCTAAASFISVFASSKWFGGATQAVIAALTCVMFFLFTQWNLDSIKLVRWTMALVVLCALIAALTSIYSYETGFQQHIFVLRDTKGIVVELPYPTSPQADVAGSFLWRIRGVGIIGDPNDFGQFLLVSIAFAGYFLTRSSIAIRLFIVTPTIGVLLLGLYMTYSRGAALAMVALVGVILIRKFGKALTGAVGGPVLVLVMTAGLLGGGRVIGAADSSAGDRILAWSEGLKMLSSSPIWGIGFNRFTDLHERTAHNSFVLSFSELGLLGYFGWLGLIVIAVSQLVKLSTLIAISKDQQFKSTYYTLVNALVVYLVCALFLSRTYDVTLYIILGMIGALRGIGGKLDRQLGSNVPPKSSFLSAVFPEQRWIVATLGWMAASIGMVFVMTRLYWTGSIS